VITTEEDSGYHARPWPVIRQKRSH